MNKKSVKILSLFGVTLFGALLLAGCSFKNSEKEQTTNNNETEVVANKNTPTKTSIENKNNVSTPSTPKDVVVDDGEKYKRVIKITQKSEKTKNETFKQINIYHDGLKTAVVYNVPETGPIPGSKIHSSFQLGEKAYTCLDINNKKECVEANENTHLVDFFNFDKLFQMIKKEGKMELKKETIKGTEMDCFIHNEKDAVEKMCAVNEQFAYGYTKNGDISVETEVVSSDDDITDGYFNLPFEKISLEDFKKENKAFFDKVEAEQKAQQEMIQKMIEQQAKKQAEEHNKTDGGTVVENTPAQDKDVQNGNTVMKETSVSE